MSLLQEAKRLVHRKVSFEKRLHAPAEREDAPLRAAPVGSALAVDGQPVGLPVDLRVHIGRDQHSDEKEPLPLLNVDSQWLHERSKIKRSRRPEDFRWGRRPRNTADSWWSNIKDRAVLTLACTGVSHNGERPIDY